MSKDKMVPVKDNRAYVKGKGACVNVDSNSYVARMKKITANRKRSQSIDEMQNKINSLEKKLDLILEHLNANSTSNK